MRDRDFTSLSNYAVQNQEQYDTEKKRFEDR